MTIRITASLAREVIPAAVLERLRPGELFTIEMALVKHILRLTNYKQYSYELRMILPTTVRKTLRARALVNFDIVVRLKYSLLSILRQRMREPKDMFPVFREFHLGPHARLIEGLRRDRLYTKAVAIARNCQWAELDNEADVVTRCQQMVADVETYIAKFTYRKHSFICTSNQMEMRDIVGDLREKAVQTFYLITPYLTPEHTLNSIKRAVHNEGINIIKFYTALKRQRLQRDDDGKFSNTIISINAMSKEGEDAGENQAVFKNVIDTRYFDVETRMSFENLMATHGVHPIKRRVLGLLALHQDNDFLQYALQQCPDQIRKTSTTTPEDVYDALGRKKYLQLVRKHVGAPKAQFYGFIKAIRQDM